MYPYKDIYNTCYAEFLQISTIYFSIGLQSVIMSQLGP